MDFSKALLELKNGKRMYRKSWVNRDIKGFNRSFIVLQKGYPDGIPCNEQTAKAFNLMKDELFKCNPYIQKQLQDLNHVMYQLTNEDLLADDWDIYLEFVNLKEVDKLW